MLLVRRRTKRSRMWSASRRTTAAPLKKVLTKAKMAKQLRLTSRNLSLWLAE
jgi:hypothetical protein